MFHILKLYFTYLKILGKSLWLGRRHFNILSFTIEFISIPFKALLLTYDSYQDRQNSSFV